jgi:hypothetical protein
MTHSSNSIIRRPAATAVRFAGSESPLFFTGLIQYPSDFRTRLSVYHSQTIPVSKTYSSL